MKPKVSVVILNYNTKYFLEQFLPSVNQSSYQNLEIVVIDNASNDDSVQYIKQNFEHIKLIELDKNYGFTGGYNRGLKLIESDFYILLNSDVQVKQNWIEPMVDLVLKDEKIAAIQPKILDYKNKNQFEYAGASGGMIDQYGFPFCRGRVFDHLEKDNGQYEDIQEVFWATGAALFVNSKLYHELGGLDEDFFAHMEEIDFCWRLQNNGYKVMVCPESVVYHVGGGTLQKSNPKKTYYNFRNGLILLIKNLPQSQLISIIIMRLILDHVAAYRWLFQGKVKDFLAVAKAHRHFIFKIKYWYKKRDHSSKMSYFNQLVLKKSIVFQYFIKKKFVFSELMK